MNEEERRTLGEKTIREVYAGDVAVPPAGYAFTDVMLKQLFAELWTREILSMRDKRILLLGITAAQGEPMPFKIHLKAALKRGEINPEEARELMLFIAQYAGYPRAASLGTVLEETITECQAERNEASEPQE